MKENFSRWYADEIKTALDKGASLDKVNIDASLIKPLHGNWLITTLQSRTASLVRGFETAGIMECLQ